VKEAELVEKIKQVKRACGKCDYWLESRVLLPTGMSSGECRVRAPVVVSTSKVITPLGFADAFKTCFPITTGLEWCGEFKLLEN